MNIFAINCGSSSIKFRLFDVDRDFRLIAKGLAERIGQKSGSIYRQSLRTSRNSDRELPLPDHRTAMHALHQALVENDSDLAGHDRQNRWRRA